MQRVFLNSGSPAHLLSILGHCIPVGSQHLLIAGGKGHYINFPDGNFRQRKAWVTCLLSYIKLVGAGTWGHSPKFQAGGWAACPDSVLSVVAVLIPSGCQLYQPALCGYLHCCQFSCLNQESFNASDWDSLRGRIWSIPDNGMVNIGFVVRLFFSIYFKDCWHTWVFLGL